MTQFANSSNREQEQNDQGGNDNELHIRELLEKAHQGEKSGGSLRDIRGVGPPSIRGEDGVLVENCSATSPFL